ncbi:MAG: hypothetical protein PHE67_07685 [Campylobacterales bacterium]|nr:hypothetical protein [Campylobacterales bacterium]
MTKAQNNSIHQAVPYSLRIWASEKDAKYWNHEKAGRGIVSYKHALSDLIDYFENVKFGRYAPNSKGISYWAYAWGWDWRKVVRFFAHCLSQIETMWASFFVKKWVQKAKRVTEQVKKSVYKSRGKAYEPAPDMKELEEEFAIAMADATNARNRTGYVLKIKKELAAKDPETCRNFQNWLEDYMGKVKAAAEAEKIEKFDFYGTLEKIAEKAGIARMRVSSNIELIMADGTSREYTKRDLYYRLIELGVIEVA